MVSKKKFIAMEYSVCWRLAILLHLGEYADDNASVSSAAQSGSLGDAEMKKKKTMMPEGQKGKKKKCI